MTNAKTPTPSPPTRLRILLLSAYDADSHKRWRTQLVQHLPQFDWTVLSLPPRFFSWRIRGNPLTWAYNEAATLQGPFDRIIATSMVDLTSLRGLLPHLSMIPTLLYFHENQFAYPVREEAVKREVFHFCMQQLLSSICADRLIFNSDYNRDTCFDGVRDLLAKMPDHTPPGIVEQLQAKASVLPVPLEPHCYFQRPARAAGPLQLLWNHRWEYDKAPERLFAAAHLLRQRNLPFVLHVVGQQFRKQPPCFAKARQELGDCIGHWGYIQDPREYRKLLQSCDLVISTALHDFQGLALLEAVAAGCRPVAPARLAYPQWIPSQCQYASHPDDLEAESIALAEHITACAAQMTSTSQIAQLDLGDISWKKMKSRYQSSIVEVGAARSAIELLSPAFLSARTT